jgi:hypothetical protein
LGSLTKSSGRDDSRSQGDESELSAHMYYLQRLNICFNYG